MTWNNYKDWLEENIIEEIKEDNTTINDDSPTYFWKLKEGVTKKYSLTNFSGLETELTKTLTDLFLSIEDDEKYYSLNETKVCHSLPSLTNFENYDLKEKSWTEIFPDRNQIIFGKKDNTKKCSNAVFNTLATIFEEWRQEEDRAKKLEKQMNEDNLAKEFMIKTAIHFNYSLLKKGDYEQKLVNWLNEYQKLGITKQEELEGRKEQTEKLLTYVREVFAAKEEQTNQSWYGKLNLTKVALYGMGLFLLIILIYWWKKAFK